MDRTRQVCERARKLSRFQRVSVTKVRSRRGDLIRVGRSYSGLLGQEICVGETLNIIRSDLVGEHLVMFTSSRVDRVFEMDRDLYVETRNSLYRLTVSPEVATQDQ